MKIFIELEPQLTFQIRISQELLLLYTDIEIVLRENMVYSLIYKINARFFPQKSINTGSSNEKFIRVSYFTFYNMNYSNMSRIIRDMENDPKETCEV